MLSGASETPWQVYEAILKSICGLRQVCDDLGAMFAPCYLLG